MSALGDWFGQGRPSNRRADVEPEPIHDADWLASQPNPYATLQDLKSRPEHMASFHVGASSQTMVQTYPETSLLVIAPGRNEAGKTNSVIIPAALSAPAAAVVVSVKTDAYEASALVTSEKGANWHYAPDGAPCLPVAKQLRTSPLEGAEDWDAALDIMDTLFGAARPKIDPTHTSEHFRELAVPAGAALLSAMKLTNRDVLDWYSVVKRKQLGRDIPPLIDELEMLGARRQMDELIGLAHTPDKERGSVLTTLGAAIRSYGTDAGLASAMNPNFNFDDFAASRDTVFITAATPRLCGPLIASFIVQCRRAARRRFEMDKIMGIRRPPMQFIIDEAGNTAPLQDLPEQVTTGGVGTITIAAFQSLSQAKQRWGKEEGSAFIETFQNVMIMRGLRGQELLDSLSALGGEYLREVVGWSEGYDPKGKPTLSRSMSHHVQKRLPIDVISEGHSQNPDLCLYFPHGGGYSWVYATPYYRSTPWPQLILKSMLKLCKERNPGERVLLPIPDLDRDGDGRYLHPIQGYEAFYEYKAEIEKLAKDYRRIEARKALGEESSTVYLWCRPEGMGSVTEVTDRMLIGGPLALEIGHRSPVRLQNPKPLASLDFYLSGEFLFQVTPISAHFDEFPPPTEVVELLHGPPSVGAVVHAYDRRGTVAIEQLAREFAKTYPTVADLGLGPTRVG